MKSALLSHKVYFASMTGLGFGKAKNISSAGAKEESPEEEIWRQLGVIPGISTSVVFPCMSVFVVADRFHLTMP